MFEIVLYKGDIYQTTFSLPHAAIQFDHWLKMSFLQWAVSAHQKSVASCCVELYPVLSSMTLLNKSVFVPMPYCFLITVALQYILKYGMAVCPS